jgi:hypothetical protein
MIGVPFAFSHVVRWSMHRRLSPFRSHSSRTFPQNWCLPVAYRHLVAS